MLDVLIITKYITLNRYKLYAKMLSNLVYETIFLDIYICIYLDIARMISYKEGHIENKMRNRKIFELKGYISKILVFYTRLCFGRIITFYRINYSSLPNKLSLLYL